VYSNEADLKMIAEMGVKPPSRKHRRKPMEKLRSAIFVVKGIVRMQRMSREWGKARKLGEGLKKAKSEVLKRRESMKKKGIE